VALSTPTTGIAGCCAQGPRAATPPRCQARQQTLAAGCGLPCDPPTAVMQRRERYHTWTCCAAGFQTGLCRLGVLAVWKRFSV